MDRLTSNRLFETLQLNNSIKQYLNLAPGLKESKIISPANGNLTSLNNKPIEHSLPNNSSSLPSSGL